MNADGGTSRDDYDKAKQSATDAESKVRQMPEYLVVCGWRSIKEVSLLLGQLTSTVPVGKTGLLTVDQVKVYHLPA